ncbi:methylmalonyl-CoA mutase family protein [Marinomonas spartinae]|uniref:methylmalonyl-CoA mutase family protein n=1 Tax=Marinomonas spartinae TaxID=1792290 RepID=UPI0018F219DB|nr:methylmalonyl-CoA mutase family protein [Marinomonas spartinae]MBJ7556799.1 cobalamin-dependent protein [Marinomonas spartinae]
MKVASFEKIEGVYSVAPETAGSWRNAHGKAPFVRGSYEKMYQQKLWTIRQYAGFEGALETNAFFKRALSQGQTGLSVAFDLPTHLGFDSDHAQASADVGRTGVAIDSVEDMAVLFDGIDLGKVSVSMTMNGAVLPIMACFIVAAEEQGVSPDKLSGTIQNDILKEYIARNTYIHSPDFSMRVVSDVVAYCAEQMPCFNSMSISGYHFQEAGASPELELALTMANARAYLTHFRQQGIDLEFIAKRLSFFFGLGMSFYKEVAKLRAARLLWSELLDEFGIHSDSAKRLKMHCQTSGVSLTESSPLNNIVRTTVEAMAGVFGGTQSLHTNSYDEAISLPSDQASNVALDTQLILQHETGIGDVVDPWGGSYMMESATQSMIEYVRNLQINIEAEGGVLALVTSGQLADFIHQQALQAAIDEEALNKKIVGKNCYLSTLASSQNVRVIASDKTRVQQTKKLAQLKLKRDDGVVKHALQALQAAARTQQNLMPFTIAAIRVRATVGECIKALTDEQSRYKKSEHIEVVSFCTHLDIDIVERYQTLSNQLGRPLRFLIAKVGLDGHDRGAKVIVSLLRDLGIEVDYLPVFSSIDDIIQQDSMHLYDGIGLSILSGAHIPFIRQISQTVRDDCPIFAGGVIPISDKNVLEKIGVDAVFTARNSLNDIAAKLLTILINSLKINVSLSSQCSVRG